MASQMKDGSYELIGGDPVLDLVNTLDWRFREGGSEELLHSYDDLLRFAKQSDILSDEQTLEIGRAASDSQKAGALAMCRLLRETAAKALYAAVDKRAPDSAALSYVAHFYKEALAHQDLGWNGGLRADWAWRVTKPRAELPVWILALGAVRLLTSDSMQRLRACEKSDCRWLFLDTSKNHTRRWCDMKLCGNRMKARRFKAQRKA